MTLRAHERIRTNSEARLMAEVSLMVLGAIAIACALVFTLLTVVVHLLGGLPLVGEALAVLLLVVGAVVGTMVVADSRSRGRLAYRDRRMGRGGRTMTVTSDDGTPLHVEVDGPSDATVTVVFAHGWMSDLGTWREQRTMLGTTTVRRVLYDQRGHGRSGWRELDGGEQGVRQLADDLYAVIRATAPTGRLILVGHSMGGMTLMALAGRYPKLMRERVDGVLLCATTASPLSESMTLGLSLRYARLQYVARRYAVAAVSLVGKLPPRFARALGIGPFRLASAVLAVAPDSPDNAHVATVGALYRTSMHVAGRCLRALMAHDERDSLDGLDPTRVTVIVPRRDRLVPVGEQFELAALAGGARVVTADNSGHMVMMEAPELVNAELLGLLLFSVHRPSDVLDF